MLSSESYFWETGVLLPEGHAEMDSYNIVWDYKHGYYNENYDLIKGDPKSLELLKEDLLSEVKQGVDRTYAIIADNGTVEYDDEDDWEYAVDKILGGEFPNCKAKDVVWSVVKIDGKLIEDFVQK